MNELELIENRAARDRLATRVDVLDKVKALALLPDDMNATVEMAAEYFEVPKKAVNSLILDHRDELEVDGLRVISGTELVSFKEMGTIPKNVSSLTVVPRRAILRIGMLLRDSQVAKTVRTYLLNVEQGAREEAPHVVQKAIAKTTRRFSWASVKSAIKQKAEIGAMAGLTPAMSMLIAFESTEKEFDVDLSMFKGQLREEKTEMTYTPTELGKHFDPALSAMKINVLLEAFGYQTKNAKSEWELTEKGKPFARLMPVQTHSKTKGVDATKYVIRWFESVLEDLKA